MVMAAGAQLLKPWPFKWLVDHVLVEPATGESVSIAPLQLALVLCVAVLLIQLVWSVLHYSGQMILLRVGLAAVLRLRTELFDWLQSLPLRFHHRGPSADSSFRLAYDAQGLQKVYHSGWATFFSSTVTLVIALVVMVLMDWRLTLVAMAVFPPVFFVLRHYAVQIRRESTRSYEKESALLSSAQEGMETVPLIQAHGREGEESSRFRGQALKSLSASLQLQRSQLRGALVASLVVAFGTALLYFFGAWQVLDERITIGSLIVFVAYLAMLYQPVESLSYTAWAMENGAASAKRCFDILDVEDDVADAPDARDAPALKGEIGFEAVSFSYEPGRMVLAGVNLQVAPGRPVFVVGPSGSGKTTLLGLVPRFYDPEEGKVTLDGSDLRKFRKATFRNQISFLLQDTFLLSTTIRENIAYGAPLAKESAIVEAAQRAGADSFIGQLPDGFQTHIGEKGVRLSAGQRQRIAMARAFLRDTPILLLDEPTSALDEETETRIMQTLRDLMTSRSTLMVTHRLHLLRDDDHIVFLQAGKIADQGLLGEIRTGAGAFQQFLNFHSARFTS